MTKNAPCKELDRKYLLVMDKVDRLGAKTATEFGVKLDLSMSRKGYARIDHISFEAYTGSVYLLEAVGRYHARNDH